MGFFDKRGTENLPLLLYSTIYYDQKSLFSRNAKRGFLGQILRGALWEKRPRLKFAP